ncbi:MAG TPA: cupin domain-containing protein [Devosia sp.]
MTNARFTRPQISMPATQRVAQTPFGARMIIHALSSETGGAFGIWDTFTPPGQGPAPHTHTRETETFRVMRGTYRFRCGEDEFDAPVGTVVVLPPHVEHAWRNISDEPGYMLGIVTPGGCEHMFLDIAALGPTATREQISAIEARYGIINEANKALPA